MFHIIVQKSILEKKKNAKKLEKAFEVFRQSGKPYEIHITDLKSDVSDTVKALTSGSGNTVVTVGGDGTLHSVLNSFVNLEDNCLALLPFGTGNDFAETAKIPLKPELSAKLIVEGSPKKIDFIELSNGLRSLNAVGMGIDVDVLKRTYAGKNKKKSKYFKAFISSLFHYKSEEFNVVCDGREEKHFGLISAVANGKQIGGGIKLFPEAEIDDGYLDVVIADYLSVTETVKAFIKLMRGKVNKVKKVTSFKTKEISFFPCSENYTIQADGELYGNTPIIAKVAEHKLNFYM